MSHLNKESLVFQVTETLTSCLAIGESKQLHKHLGIAQNYIYSWGTFHTYMQQCIAFARWAQSAHGCNDIASAKRYVPEYLFNLHCMDRSPYTIKMVISALAKLYQCHGADFGVKVSSRSRSAIIRSRIPVSRDDGFSLSRNTVLIAFCRCSGLRRSELKCLTGDRLVSHRDGTYAIRVTSGAKGGRYREAPLVGPEEEINLVVSIMRAAGKEKVFPYVHSHADIHGMRAEYAVRVYLKYALPYADIRDAKFWNPHRGLESRVYYCRKDRKGMWYDKYAMQKVALALGHSRISVVGEHYLHALCPYDTNPDMIAMTDNTRDVD